MWTSSGDKKIEIVVCCVFSLVIMFVTVPSEGEVISLGLDKCERLVGNL